MEPQLSIRIISDAIRKNGLEQAIGGWYHSPYGEHPERACALGQAAINIYDIQDSDRYTDNIQIHGNKLLSFLNGLYNQPASGYYIYNIDKRFSCPDPVFHAEEQYQTVLGDMIIHLNDTHKWTLEQIANYLRNIEEQER